MKTIRLKDTIAVALSLIFTLLAATGVLAATAGTLDSSFDNDGLVTTAFPNYTQTMGADLALQQDGKIVVAGTTDYHFGVARYNINGSLDTSFDTDGRVDTDLGSGAQATSVAIQNDGKIIVVGIIPIVVGGSNYQFALVRYNSNGTLDTSFDTDGKVFTNLGDEYDAAFDVAIQPNGKIVVVGYTQLTSVTDNAIAVVRYNINGSLDTTFDTDGVVTTSLGNSSGGSVAIQTDGKIVVGARGGNGLTLVRYNSNGSLDTSFDTDGLVTNGNGGTLVKIQPNGKILVGGSHTYGQNGYGYFTLARYNSNGSLDTSFGTNGKVATPITTSGYTGASSIALQANGKIILAGHDNYGPSGDDFVLVRYNNNGSLDTGFGVDGTINTDFGAQKEDIATAVAVQSDGNIIVAGYSYLGNGITKYAFALARYLGETITHTANFKSIAAHDGWVLESSEASSVGGSINNSDPTLWIGDDASKKQYRGVLSFNTSSLPDNAAITSVTLKVKKNNIVGGGNPISTFQGFKVDIQTGFLNTTAALQLTDFQTVSSKTLGPFSPTPSNDWYSINLTTGKAYINKLSTNNGLTQLRLRFTLDDNNNTIANYLSLFSGNASADNRPQLAITYYVP